MKKILESVLRFLAAKALKKYKPKVIGITGSMGKTSCKEAVFAVLSKNFNVRKNEKNYNNEIGVPLTILGLESAGKNFFGWLSVFFKGFLMLIKKQKIYPEILILEMGADHPGDLKYLTDNFPCDMGIVTSVGPVHLEFFETIEKVAKEKSIMVSHLEKDGLAILNADDSLVYKMKDGLKAKAMTFGFSDFADVKAFELTNPNLGINFDGMRFKMSYNGSVVPALLPGVIGSHQIFAALAATCVGVSLGLNLVEISENLKGYQSPPGRMNVIEGIKHTLIIDDTYNSSPLAAIKALDTVGRIELPAGNYKYAVLSDMLELGNFSEKGHAQVGEKVSQMGFDYLVTVGKESLKTAEAAIATGFAKERIANFEDSESAGKFLQEKIKQGDLLLIKGSQVMRMEKAVKELMANPLMAEKLLVRQNEEWLKK